MAMAEATLNWTHAATLEDVWEGEILEVEVDGVPVLLAHLPGGSIVAYQGLCPHQERSLEDGDFDEDTGVLTCAAHHWQFQLADGSGVNPDGCRLYRYEVRVEDGAIHVGYPAGNDDRYHHFRED
jgi:toluene monooxygenase system ferredoxin subunit